MAEVFEWKKALYGLVDLTRWGKTLFDGIRLVIIGIVAYLLFVGAVAIWKHWVPQKKVKTPYTISSISCDNGKCEVSSGDKTNKFGLISF